MDKAELLKEAIKARENSYAPYSKFAVGAALLTKSGKLYRGCNIENAAFSATNCAERTAFFKAISEGEREFEAIAIAGGPAGREPEKPCAPCGICRQVMMEFCDPATFQIVLGTGEANVCAYTLEELLPLGFGPDELLK
jgi:cytidine deaminase